MSELYKSLNERYESMKNRRRLYETAWSAIQALVRPNSPDSPGEMNVQGQAKSNRIYDGTALLANEELAAGIHSYKSSPSERWFAFGHPTREPETLTLSERTDLEKAADYVFHYLSKPVTNFNPALHEVYLDIGAFGTAVMEVDVNSRLKDLNFRAHPLLDCWIDENVDGVVDCVFRVQRMTRRQILQQFGSSAPKVVKDHAGAQPTELFRIYHAVYPRKERRMGLPSRTSMRYASVYFMDEDQTILDEGGYNHFPYLVPRWSKLSGELYGRSPAWNCLPDIQMLQHMMKEMIISAQLANRPPLAIFEDSFLPPMALKPGALLTLTLGSEMPQPLMSGSQPQFTFEMMSAARSHINSCFYIDFLKNEYKKERQTAYEIADRRDEKLQLLSPILSRLESEFYEPLLRTTLELIKRVNPEALPRELQAESFDRNITFVSTASRAQLSGKASLMSRFMEELAPIANIMPEILDAVDPDRFVQQLATLRSVSPKILRSKQELTELREARAEQQQQANASEAASATRDMAAAHKDMRA